MWQQWMNAVLGLWIIAVPFIGFAAETLTWTLLVTGAVVAALAVWGAGQHQTYGTGDRGVNRERGFQR